jgi:hypothetical protein
MVSLVRKIIIITLGAMLQAPGVIVVRKQKKIKMKKNVPANHWQRLETQISRPLLSLWNVGAMVVAVGTSL